MAPKYKMPGLRKALKAVEQLGSQMTAEADADYAVALSASRAGQAGLAAQTRGLTRDLLSGQVKANASLSKLARTARAQKNVVASHQQNTVRRYGTALGESISQSYSVARAGAKGTAKIVGGQAKQSKGLTKTASTVAGIAQMGVAAQASAAKYSLNQALQQRAIIDNQTLAGLTGSLYQSALQYNAQMAMYEKQRADAKADAAEAAEQSTALATNWLTTKGGEMGAWLDGLRGTGQYVDPETGEFSVQKALAAYIEEYALNPEVNPNDANTIAVMSAALGKMKDGLAPTTALAEAANELYSSLPGWDKVGPNVLGAIDSDTQARVEAMAMVNIQSITGVSFGDSRVSTADMGALGVATGALGLGGGPVQPGALEGRDAAAAAITQQYGASTTKAWLRGQTNWSDEAIDWYIANLPPELAGTLSGPTTPSVPVTSPPSPFGGKGGSYG